MATFHYNITNEIATELLAHGDNAKISSVHLANKSDVPVYVDLYIEKLSTGKFYFLKNYFLQGSDFLLKTVSFNNSLKEFGLYVKLTKIGETPAVDVILI